MSQYIHFGFSKSVLLGDSVHGVFWVAGAAPLPRKGWVAVGTGLAWLGLRLRLRDEGWGWGLRLRAEGSRAWGINSANPVLLQPLRLCRRRRGAFGICCSQVTVLHIYPQKARKIPIKTGSGDVGKAESTDAGSFTPGCWPPRPRHAPSCCGSPVWVLKRSVEDEGKAAKSSHIWRVLAVVQRVFESRGETQCMWS